MQEIAMATDKQLKTIAQLKANYDYVNSPNRKFEHNVALTIPMMDSFLVGAATKGSLKNKVLAGGSQLKDWGIFLAITTLYNKAVDKVGLAVEFKLPSQTELETWVLGKLKKEVVLGTWYLGCLQIIFYPNEIFSAYMDGLDLDKKMLVSYSNGYGPYILPIMFLDTLTNTTKERIIEAIQTI